MNFFKLFLLTAGAFTAMAQPSPTKLVALNVVALDSTGKPVKDLTASGISVFDNNSRQKIVNLRLNQSDGPRALVVLFDLMNSSENSRGAIWDAMKKSLAHMPASDSLYLYLLVEDGSLYPVHPLSAAPTEPWTEDAWEQGSFSLKSRSIRQTQA